MTKKEHCMKNYSDTYDTCYQNNAASILCYKSNRKNSKCSDFINIFHLLNHEPDRRVSDSKIIDQMVETVEKIVWYCKQYNHIELSVYMSVSKQTEYENANKEIYHGVDDLDYCFNHVIFSSIEQCINFVFNIYSLIYPYNKIGRKTLHNNASIRYFIDQYYSR